MFKTLCCNRDVGKEDYNQLAQTFSLFWSYRGAFVYWVNGSGSVKIMRCPLCGELQQNQAQSDGDSTSANPSNLPKLP
jgi:hypothetical protein